MYWAVEFCSGVIWFHKKSPLFFLRQSLIMFESLMELYGFINVQSVYIAENDIHTVEAEYLKYACQ